MDNYEKI